MGLTNHLLTGMILQVIAGFWAHFAPPHRDWRLGGWATEFARLQTGASRSVLAAVKMGRFF